MSQSPSLLLVGLNHQVAPVALRERLAFGAERLPAALHQLLSLKSGGAGPREPVLQEAALLSTCNRTELYLAAPQADRARQAILTFLGAYAGLPYGELTACLYFQEDLEAVRHLFRVAAGLDSLLMGENEILGQVRGAYAAAQAAGAAGPCLAALFQAALATGKRVRAETELGRASLTYGDVVVELAQETFGCLAERTVLLVGAGKINTIAGRALVAAGLRCVLVANRTYDRAKKLAESLHGQAVHFDALSASLASADIVICSTGAPHLVLHAATVQAAQSSRGGRPLLIADLAVPRDVDPAAGSLPGVRLVDMDGLGTQVKARHPLAASVQSAAEAIVAEGFAAYCCEQQERTRAPLIQALYDQAGAVVQQQVARTARRLGPLTPEQEDALRQMGTSIASKLLHAPTAHLRRPPPEIAPEEYAAWVANLFDLQGF